MNLLISALKSRTIQFSILLAILSVVQGYLHVFNLTPYDEMLTGIAISVAVTILRSITTMALANK